LLRPGSSARPVGAPALGWLADGRLARDRLRYADPVLAGVVTVVVTVVVVEVVVEVVGHSRRHGQRAKGRPRALPGRR